MEPWSGEGKVWTKKFTRSTKSTVHQGSAQRLIPPRGRAPRRSVFSIASISPPTPFTRFVSIAKRPPPSPFLPHRVIITGCYNLPRQTRRARCTSLSQLFPPSREILLSWRVPSLRRKLFANSLALAKVSGEFARLKLCGDGLRGCWESNRRFCRIINITWTTLIDFQYFFRCFLKIQRSVNEIW